jgi:hypothetical protein
MADPASSQWPDSLAFWLLITALVIAVPSALCAFGFHLLRRAW